MKKGYNLLTKFKYVKEKKTIHAFLKNVFNSKLHNKHFFLQYMFIKINYFTFYLMYFTIYVFFFKKKMISNRLCCEKNIIMQNITY